MSETMNIPYHFSMGNVKCSTHTIPQLLDEIQYLLEHPVVRSRSILCVNAHIYNLAAEDAALRSYLNTARVVTADGMSIVWLSRLWGPRIEARCNMTEAFRAFLEANSFRPTRGILIGSTQEDAEAAARAIEAASSHCKIVRAYSGFHSDDEYRELFSSLDPVDFIYIGMGTPRTERIVNMSSELCPGAIAWGIGAGTIRIYAGVLKEAPAFWRKSGLQWFHRLCKEPRHLWRRYLLGNPLFLARTLSHRVRRAASHAFDGSNVTREQELPVAATVRVHANGAHSKPDPITARHL